MMMTNINMNIKLFNSAQDRDFSAVFDTAKMKVHVYEAITTENETNFEGTVKELEGKEFSDLSVMVFNQASLDSYMNYRWQWEN